MSEPGGRILLASFKPLGGQRNVSGLICEMLAAERSHLLVNVTLDVGPGCEHQLEEGLGTNPGGVLLTDDNAALHWHHFRIEDRAFDLQSQIDVLPGLWGWGRGDDRMPSVRELSSDFAPAARAAVGATGLTEMMDHLTGNAGGPFWCNRVYYRALDWGRPQNKPVLFIHLGISGATESKLDPLRKILDLMISYAHGKSA